MAAVREKVITMRHKTATEHELNAIGKLDAIEKQPVRESAKQWFKRPLYDIQRGDSGGQTKIKSVSSDTERKTETQKGD